jgi:hypothetical protein
MARLSVLKAGLGLLWLTGCGDLGVDGNGERSEELRETSAFSRIRSDSELDVEAVQGGAPSVVVSIDSNLQSRVKTRIADDTLYIDTHDELDEILDGPHVLITVPSLTAAKLAGSGSMALWFDEPSGAVDLYLSGSGRVRFEGQTAAVGAFLSGSGSIRLEGRTGDAELELSGSGYIRAESLSATSANIDLSGSGDVSANVSDSVSVSLSGSGDIELYGEATLADHEVTGSGDVIRR